MEKQWLMGNCEIHLSAREAYVLMRQENHVGGSLLEMLDLSKLAVSFGEQSLLAAVSFCRGV